MKKKNNAIIFVILGVVVFALIFIGISLTKNLGKNDSTISMENAINELNKMYKKINVKTSNIQRSNAIATDTEATVLPDISEYPFVVNPTTDNFITIYASTEKAGNDEAWLCKTAKSFNESNPSINGVPISVGVRAISSNLAADFIITEKYTPELYMPSSSLYGKLFDSKEKKYTVVADSVVNNVSGIVLSKKAKENIKSKHNGEDATAVINAVLSGDAIIGYTNPLSNEDGLNYLLTLLSTFDSNAPLGAAAVDKLKNYQDKIPYVPYEISQLQDSINNGTIDGFASNYQKYYTTPELRNSYEFIPFGVVQDNPAYMVGDVSGIKKEICEQFANYCKEDGIQQNASNDGYNAMKDYSYNGYSFSGQEIVEAQNTWKKEKNGSSDLTAVFVSDVSGSMDGSPLLKLKASLNRASTFIDENTNIGLVTFSDDVHIDLPIAKFDETQKAYFANAVKSMRASGGTAMYNAIIVAEHMLIEQREKNPNTRLMLFVLTDGENNRGYEFEEIEKVARDLRIPIYTIGYNADIEILKTISDINEATTMDADSDNVIYKLESLFNSQM